MYCDVCLRNGTVYLPTMGKMGKGFYRGVEPVAAIAASNTGALRQALADTIARGNPEVPMLRRREWPPPVVLKYAEVRSWSAFERGMRLWSITKNDRNFEISEQKKQPDKMWRSDPVETITFPSESTVDEVVERMVKILRDAAQR